jgi:hypothetical protein
MEVDVGFSHIMKVNHVLDLSLYEGQGKEIMRHQIIRVKFTFKQILIEFIFFQLLQESIPCIEGPGRQIQIGSTCYGFIIQISGAPFGFWRLLRRELRVLTSLRGNVCSVLPATLFPLDYDPMPRTHYRSGWEFYNSVQG